MKLLVIKLVLTALFCSVAINGLAQPGDPEVAALQQLTGTIEKINAYPIEFEIGTDRLTPAALANLRQQAALLKALPTGTVVEIGVHTVVGGNETANVELTRRRGERVRAALIALGVSPASLEARGYGSSQPPADNEASRRRVEFRVVKLGPAGTIPPALPKGPAADASLIVAARGWGTVTLGASRSQIEAVLGAPEVTGAESDGGMYATHYARGIVVVYGARGVGAVTIRIIGDRSLYGGSSSKFSSSSARPDKGLAWGASAQQVISAYGQPIEREAYKDYPTEVEILNLRYPGAEFMLKGDRLFQINISHAKTTPNIDGF